MYTVSDEQPASYGRFATFPVRTSIQQLRTYLKGITHLLPSVHYLTLLWFVSSQTKIWAL